MEVYVEDVQEKEETKVERIIRLRDESISQCSTAINNTKTNWSYFENDPYTSKEKADAKKYGKNLLKFPVMQNKLLVMIGKEEQQRKEAKIVTDNREEFDTVDIINRHYSFLRSQSNLQEMQAKMMADGLISQTGGWIRQTLYQTERGYLDFGWDNIDTLSVHPDPSFHRLDLLDCDWIVVDNYMTLEDMKDEFEAYFKEKDWTQVEAKLVPTENKGLSENLEIRGNKYPVLEFHERVKRKYAVMSIANASGSGNRIELISKKDRKRYEREGWQYIQTVRKQLIRKTIISPHHNQILYEEDQSRNTKYYELFCYFSYDYNIEKIKIPSMVGLLTDVQDQINKEKSQNTQFAKQALDIIWHVGKNESEAAERLEKYHGEPKMVVKYKNLDNMARRDEPGGGAIAAIQALANNVLGNVDLISEVSGVKEPLSGGGVKSSTSGVLYRAQQESAATGVNPFFEILTRVRKYMTDRYLDLCPEVYAEQLRAIEIEDDYKNFQNAMLNIPYAGNIYNDIRRMSARATIDEGEKSKDYRNEMFEMMTGFVHIMSQTGASFEQLPWPYLLEYSNMQNKDEVIKFVIEQMYNAKMSKIESNVDARLGARV
ncbi:MAG: portal protein [Candidatus Syntropharchaeales archaeon]